MKDVDRCYGVPGRQKVVKWVHCPNCLRTWGLTTRKKCVNCDTPLKDGEAPKPKFDITTIIKEMGGRF